MYVSMQVPMCDIEGVQYDSPVQGAGIVVRGATGRYCVTMYIGPEMLERSGIVPMSYEEAVSMIESKKDGYVEF